MCCSTRKQYAQKVLFAIVAAFANQVAAANLIVTGGKLRGLQTIGMGREAEISDGLFLRDWTQHDEPQADQRPGRRPYGHPKKICHAARPLSLLF